MSLRAGPWKRTWTILTRGAAFEMSVLVLAIGALGLAIGATVVAGSRPSADLEFDGARDEIRAIIQNRGDRGIAAPRRWLDSAGRTLVVVDTLAPIGDSLEIPSLARGGFLRDQIELFNESAVWQAWSPQLTGRAAVEPPASPSLLRLARTEDRGYVLSSDVNAFVLRVPAPESSRPMTTVRASDWHTGAGVIGLLRELDLSGATGSLSPPAVLSHSACRAKVISAAEQLLYCGSLAGANVGAGYDLRVESRGAGARAGLQLTPAGGTPVWLNGERVPPPVMAHAGDLLFTSRMGPGMISALESGTLAGPQWENGQVTFRLAHEGVLRFLGRADRSTAGPRRPAPLTLTVDAALTLDLEARVRRFTTRLDDYLESMSVSVVDVASGELRTIAESGAGEGAPLLAFQPMLIGSMSKPILAAAILSRQPSLADLTLTRTDGPISSVAGLPLEVALGNAANHCPGVIAFQDFLRCSSNQFAAELLVRSLQQSAGRHEIAVRGRVPNAVLESSALADGIASLYDDADVVAKRIPGRTTRIWQRDSASIAEVPADRTLYPWASRPWFIQPDSSGVPLDWLARFAIGGWENRWTLVGALEAYARIATDRRVRVTLLPPTPGRGSIARAVSPEAARAFHTVRRGLRKVASEGTAAGLDRAMATVARDSASVVVLAKTGTLNEVSERQGDEGVFLKALAVTVGAPTVAGDDGAPLRCGLGAIIYLQFRQDWRERMRLPTNSSLPDLHREFAQSELAQALRAFWARRDPCATGAR